MNTHPPKSASITGKKNEKKGFSGKPAEEYLPGRIHDLTVKLLVPEA